MKSYFNFMLFFAGISLALATACKKSSDNPEPRPYYTVLPDTNRFAVPNTYSWVNGYTTYYYPNSNVISSEGNYQNGSPAGYWKLYYANGNKMKEGNYANGRLSGNWIFYYESGGKKEEGNYQNNIRSGNWIFYYESGTISAQGNYSNGNKEGVWKYYNTDGTSSSTVIY